MIYSQYIPYMGSPAVRALWPLRCWPSTSAACPSRCWSTERQRVSGQLVHQHEGTSDIMWGTTELEIVTVRLSKLEFQWLENDISIWLKNGFQPVSIIGVTGNCWNSLISTTWFLSTKNSVNNFQAWFLSTIVNVPRMNHDFHQTSNNHLLDYVSPTSTTLHVAGSVYSKPCRSSWKKIAARCRERLWIPVQPLWLFPKNKPNYCFDSNGGKKRPSAIISHEEWPFAVEVLSLIQYQSLGWCFLRDSIPIRLIIPTGDPISKPRPSLDASGFLNTFILTVC